MCLCCPCKRTLHIRNAFVGQADDFKKVVLVKVSGVLSHCAADNVQVGAHAPVALWARRFARKQAINNIAIPS